MRVKVRISLSHVSDVEPDLKAIIASFLVSRPGYQTNYERLDTPPIGGVVKARTHHYFDVFTDDERYTLLKNELEDKGIKFREMGRKMFAEEELAAAEYLQFGAAGMWGYPQPEDSDEWKNASFDLTTACPVCGYGAIQDRPYLIKGVPKLGRNSIIELNWSYDLLVTDQLRNLIQSEGLTGSEFWPLIRYKKGGTLDGFHQLYVRDELPSMSSNTKIVQFPLARIHGGGPCPTGRIGRMLAVDPVFNLDSVLVPIRYKREALVDAKDFNLTREWLSYGYDARRWFIVSSRVYGLFVKHEIRGGEFEPVILED